MRVSVAWAAWLLPLQVAAATGDVVPRTTGGDGLVSVSDIVAARRMADELDVATTAERRAVDAASGAVEPAFLTPPTRLPAPDGTIDDADVRALVDVLLGRERFPDTPGIVLEEARPVALAGVAWRNRAVAVGRSLRRPAFTAEGAPDGLVIDAVTGEISWTPTPSDVGVLSFDIVAVAPPESLRCRVTVDVVVPRAEASGEAGPAGLELAVDDPASPVNGLRLEIASGPPEPVAVTVLTSPDAAREARDDGLPLGPPVVVATTVTSDAEISLPVTDALVAAAGGTERLAWQVLAVPFADCEDLAASEGHAAAWPAWSRVPTSVEEGRVIATVPLRCTGPAMARLVAVAPPAAGCPAPDGDERVVLDVRQCPTSGTWLVGDAASAVARALDRFEALGHDVPASARVVIDDLGTGHVAYADAVAEATIRLDASLTRERMLVAAAHEAFHLCQQRALGSDCSASRAARGSHALLVEGLATWMEQEVFGEPADPVPSDAVSGRVLGSMTRRPLDALGAEGWPFFDWLDTSLGVTGLDVLARGPALLATPPLQTLDELVTEAGRGPWPEALTRFAHDLNAERDPRFIRELEEMALPPVVSDVLDGSVTEADPLTRCDVVLPPGAAFTWPLIINVSQADQGLATRLSVEAAGDVQATFYAVDGPERLRTIASGETAVIGLGVGPAALHVVNAALDGASAEPAVVSLSAWVAAADPYEPDSDGDGWPDRAEEEAGTDPRRASSYPRDTFVAAPPVALALTARDVVVTQPSPLVGLGSSATFVAAPRIQLALTERDAVVASPPALVALTQRDVVVAEPIVTLVPDVP